MIKAMAKLKIESLHDDKPVKITVELPADVDRDLRAYAEIIKRERGESVSDPTKLIAPMLRRFMSTDRAFRKLRRQSAQDRTG
jgi:hypothetical protein